MKRVITALLMAYSAFAVAAPNGPLLPITPLSMPLPAGVLPQSNSAMEFSRVRVAEAVEAMYTQILKTPYLIQPEVVADERLVSFRFGTGVSARSEVSRFMGLLGLSVRTVNGVDIVGIVKEVEPDKEPFVYRPKYRDVTYLVELLRGLFPKGEFTSTRSIHGAPQAITADAATGQSKAPAPAGSAASLLDTDPDALVFNGTETDIKKLSSLLAQLDTRQGEVMVRGQVFEVASNGAEGSAFSLALHLLGGTVSAGVSTPSTLDGFVRIKNASIDAVFAALSSDSRFKTISAPSLRVRSGAAGRFAVGQDVPVLGAISYPGNGSAPVQSVEYRSSGVIFDLKPIVRESVVDLTVGQQLSNFIVTQTGVNNSPTLTKREVSTSLSVADGDVVIIGGLAENRESSGRVGFSFLPDWMRSNTGQTGKTEILLVLQVTKL
ncbi:type II secretory pathway, component PulD [Herbaspirillum huttiense F1]|uniref:type II secretion system protein GspD n=1 Tax=Herbaspirillum huttiense TaxID=863372 RepID=UPI0028860870|nr:type II secretory pathway, component PulD [Herbaspirillum huttiense]MDT0358121.1 type II secretory pathway, component PulD [Herbaspirillum huttiense F1]